MTPFPHLARFALISQSAHLSFDQVKAIASAINAQLREDFTPLWGRSGQVLALASAEELPQGAWPVYIRDRLDEPGALGYHTDIHGQPVAYVQYDGDQTGVTVSHEILETMADPFGNRFTVPRDLGKKWGVCQILLEDCDPCEAITYKKGGIDVSDFLRPEWYDQDYIKGHKYTFLSSIDRPLRIIPGGYFSFMDRNHHWHQQTWFGGNEPIYSTLGRKQDKTQSVREWIDQLTRGRQKVL